MKTNRILLIIAFVMVALLAGTMLTSCAAGSMLDSGRSSSDYLEGPPAATRVKLWLTISGKKQGKLSSPV